MRLSRPMTREVRGGDVGDSLSIDADELNSVSDRTFLTKYLDLHDGAAAPPATGQEAPWWAGGEEV